MRAITHTRDDRDGISNLVLLQLSYPTQHQPNHPHCHGHCQGYTSNARFHLAHEDSIIQLPLPCSSTCGLCCRVVRADIRHLTTVVQFRYEPRLLQLRTGRLWMNRLAQYRTGKVCDQSAAQRT